MNTTIIQAINSRATLELRYSGYSREVEPHAYGRDKDGDEVLRCYQTGGGSVSGERAGWKLLKVRDIYSLHAQKNQFNTRPEYRKDDKSMVHIFAQL